MSKTIQKILADPRVESVSDERHLDSGFWVYPKPGYCNYDEDPVAAECGDALHALHTNTPSEALRKLNWLKPEPKRRL